MSHTNREILIVEDDEAIATGLAHNLKLEGYRSSVVTDGDGALARIVADPPDLVLLDISLPKKNGLDVLRELRDAGNNVPVIILSARQDEFDKVSALRLGADDYVTKP
ncbi:MAG: response regulator, partial [Mariprofundaceae bacterium]